MAVTGGSGTLPTIVIVGAGAAGIFTAYLINKHWPGQFDVQLFEASPAVGGNVSSSSASLRTCDVRLPPSRAALRRDSPQPWQSG